MDDNYADSSDPDEPHPAIHHSTIRWLTLSLLSLLVSTQLLAQRVTIRGKVLNARTNAAVEFSNVLEQGTTNGTQSDLNGAYALEVLPGTVSLKASFVGYTPDVKTLTVDGSKKVIVLNFRLQPEQKSLTEVTVRGKRERYRNKDNPAVALIEKVIAHKARNRKEAYSFYQYNKYEKVEFDLSNISEKFRNRRSLKKFDFVFNYLDTSQVTGKVNLPIYLKEAVSNVFYSRNPEHKKEMVQGEKMTGLGNYVDNNGIKLYLETLYQDVNVYDNNIMLLSNQFLSPTAQLAPQFYKYVIIDSTTIKGVRCVNLGFSPRNKTDLLFQGTMSVALDSSYAIRKIIMGFSKDINVNFVTDMRLAQEYDFVQDQGLMLTKDELAIEFNLLKKENGMGLFGQRSVSYRDYVLNKPIDPRVFTGLTVDVQQEATTRNDSFWAEARHQPLSSKEQGIYAMVDSVKKVPVFQKFMNTAMFLLEGYKPIGPFEIGPVSTFYSFNPVEGFRLRAGGRTTTTFSDRMAFETYGAYGFRDKRFKYFASATFSLTNHNTYTYPIKHIQVSVQNELKIPGQELQFVQEDNFLLSFKRGPNNRRTYNQVFNIDYLNESKSGLALNINAKRIEQSPAGALTFDQYTADGNTRLIPNVTSTELTVGLRYAPHEQFYQGKNYRVPIVNKYPIFQVRFTSGVKLLGGQYNFQRLMAYANKRFYVSPIGYTDVTIEGGQTFGRVPFPLLTIHRANQTYAYQPESYNMMNFLEFVSDHYGAVFADHYFNGFIFNKIPLLKKLKLREVVTFKGLWGGLRPENRPTPDNMAGTPDSGLLRLPTDASGQPVSFWLDSRPYMEASVGIANIFKILRVDLIKRLTYLDHPNAPQGYGIRFRMKFDF